MLPLLLLRGGCWSRSHAHVTHLHTKWSLYVWIVPPRGTERHHPIPILSILVGILGGLVALLIPWAYLGSHPRTPLNLYALLVAR